MVMVAVPVMTACHDDKGKDNDSIAYSGIPLVIYDTDIGSSTDDLVALDMIYKYMDEGRCTLLGLMVNREGEECAMLADLMNTYYGHPDIPIGVERNGVNEPKVYIDYKFLPNLFDDEGDLMFKRSITDYSALPDSWRLYRRLLAEQPDHSVSIISVGFVTSLTHLLESQPDEFSPLNGVELVRDKVKCLYLMGGSFGNAVEPIEYNFLQSLGFAQKLFALWPSDVDIMMSPGEVGDGVFYAPETVIADIDWTDRHPIKQVYMNCDCNSSQKMWDPLPVIQVIEGDSLFSLSERGTVTVNDKAETFFSPSPSGFCLHQLPGSEQWNDKMLEIIREKVKTR